MKNMYRITAITCVAFTSMALMMGCAPKSATHDETNKIIVATVNDVPISMDKLIKTMNRLAAKTTEPPTPETTEKIRKKALDRLIFQELAYQEAVKQKIAVEPAKIDIAIANFKENIGGEEAYENYLKKQGVTEGALRKQVERRLVLETIYAREVLGKIDIPENVVREEYEREKHRYVLPEKVKVIDVFILQNDGRQASRKRARSLLKKIQADKNQDPWSLVLDGTFIVRNLDVNKEKHKELYAVAKKLKPDGLSGIIKAADGYHIIKLKTYSAEKQLTFDEVRKSLEQKFRPPAQDKRLREWEQELKKDAKIEIIPYDTAHEKS